MRIVLVNATSVRKEKIMKMTVISITKSWFCATGVAIIASYCILTHNGTVNGKSKAEQVASRICKDGTTSEYKSKNRHSSATKKTTTAKVAKEIKIPKYIPNPICPPFTNAVNKLTEEMYGIAKGGEVRLKNGFSLLNKNGKPTIVFPEAYTNVCIGGVAMGAVFKGGNFLVRRTKIDDTNQEMIDKVSLSLGISALTSRSSTARKLHIRCFPRLCRLSPFG